MARRRLLKMEEPIIIVGDFRVALRVATGITEHTLAVECPSAVTGEHIVSPTGTIFYDTTLTDAQVANLVLSASPEAAEMFNAASSFINTDHSVTKTDIKRNETYKFITLYCNSNVGGDKRKGDIYIKQGDDVLAIITVTQIGIERLQRLETACGVENWTLGEERITSGLWLWIEKIGNTENIANSEDVDDEVDWSEMLRDGLFQEIGNKSDWGGHHKFKAIDVGYTQVITRYSGEHHLEGDDSYTHHYEVSS